MHFTSKNMYNRIYYQNRIRKAKENNTCPNCGKEMDRDGFYCKECVVKRSKYISDKRKDFKEMGLCPRCGNVELFGDEKQCPECSAKQYANIIRTRDRQHYNQLHREWSRKTHSEMIENGICTRCRKRKADYGYKTCGICRNELREYKRIKYGKPDRQERYKQGLCFFCDNPLKIGYKVCEKHYQMNVEKSHCQNAKISRKKLIKEGILY